MFIVDRVILHGVPPSLLALQLSYQQMRGLFLKEQRRVVLQELEQTSQQLGQENSCRHAHFVGSTDWQFAWQFAWPVPVSGAAGTYGFAAAKGAMDGTTPAEN